MHARVVGRLEKGRSVSRLLITFGLWLCLVPPASGITVPPGFQHETVLSGLQFPTAVRFSPDGRVFVAEKSGLIQVFDGLGDPTPTVFADLRRQVFNAWDRGLLGFVLHPDFPSTPWVYVLYTHNALPGGAAPQWPATDPELTFDYCPDPPGGMVDGCVVTGRLSRLAVDGPTQVTEHVLIEDNWCQQYPSHSVGDLAFGPDGALYVSAGEGANFGAADWGQYGGSTPDPILAPIPRNPCGDPPGDAMTPPTAEGGALRAQDLRTPGDPVSYGGTVLRVDPETGAALPDNPLWGGATPEDDRVVAYGLRNPYRFTVRPGTSELWIGDVGWDIWEEINRVVDPTGLHLANFGWPCWEGGIRQPAFASAGLAICESLYADGTDTKPFLASRHGDPLGDDACTSASSSITGLAFYDGGTYPPEYTNALFFTDFGRNCLWAMLPDERGVPDPTAIVTVASGLPGPVMLERGPGGDLFYVEVGGLGWLDGKVHRIRYLGSNHPPVAIATADVASGTSPLTVRFDGSASSDPDEGDVLAFAWDLDGDGEFDDADGPAPGYTYDTGTWHVRLRVTDGAGASDTATLTVNVDNTPPTAIISSPAPSLQWSVGQAIALSGSALDAEQGTLPDSALRWQIVMLHCPGFDCHVHLVQELGGGGQAVFVAPDHEYPSFLEIVLTAVDAGGLSHTTSVQLQPNTTSLWFDSTPSGLTLAVGSTANVTPFARDVIVGSQNSVAAPSPQTLAGIPYSFASWSDGGPQAHNVLADAGGGSWAATYAGGACGNGVREAGETCDDGNLQDGDCCTAACTLTPAGTACRAAAGPCDVAETCDGVVATCPADAYAPPTQECRPAADACDPAERCTGMTASCPADVTAGDPDGDGLCTAVDPCTGGVPFRTTRLGLRGLGTRPGNDRLRLWGSATLPPEAAAFVDPSVHGMRLVLHDDVGATVLDATLPAGSAWKTVGAGNWRYQPGDSKPGGIARATLRLSRNSGRLTVRVTGRRSTYPLDPPRTPGNLTVVLDPPAAATGLCIERTSWPTGCLAGSRGAAITCR